MSVGLGLLHRLIKENRSVSYLADHGITADAFEKQEEIDVLKYIESHYRKFGVVPDAETVEQETKVKFGKFSDEPIGYWIENVKDRFSSSLILKASKSLKNKIANGELASAIDAAKDLVLSLDHVSPADRILTLGEMSHKVLDSHDKRQHSSRMAGVPFGIDYLDKVTDGAQGGDTVALVGRPGVGKTYFLLKMALSAWLQGEIPLVHSMEMDQEKCARRIVALKSNVNATLIRLGRLSYYGRRRLVANIGEIDEFNDRPFYLMQGSLRSTVEDLAVKVQELKPTVLMVDGAYLLKTRSKFGARWERVAETAELLKMIATEFKIPSIATYQFNKKGPGSLGNIMYSDAIGQLASIVCGIADEDTENTGKSTWSAVAYKLLTLLKGREGEKGIIRVLYDMNRMLIEQDSVISGYDYALRDEEDETWTPEDED